MPKANLCPFKIGDSAKNRDTGERGTIVYLATDAALSDCIIVKFHGRRDALLVDSATCGGRHEDAAD